MKTKKYIVTGHYIGNSDYDYEVGEFFDLKEGLMNIITDFRNARGRFKYEIEEITE